VHGKLKQRLRELGEEPRPSITFDNGTEFARCHRLEKHLGMTLYFADPGVRINAARTKTPMA
jgi:IS30 family transposase